MKLTKMDIKLSLLINDWLNITSSHYYLMNRATYTLDNGIFGIECYCHPQVAYGDRWMGIVMDNEPVVRLFPLSDMCQPNDVDSWIHIRPEDPEFFTKLIKSLDEVHIKRYGTEVVRFNPRLGAGEELAHQDYAIKTVH